MYKTDLRNYDVLFRKLLRSVVGPPAGMDWTRPWHEILHDWNGRVNEFAALHSIKLWSERCTLTLTLTLRLHVRRQPSLGRRQCETKTSASGAKLYKIITQLHPQRRILCKVIPLAPLSKTRVCHKLASPIMAWVPPSSCTSRIPK